MSIEESAAATFSTFFSLFSSLFLSLPVPVAEVVAEAATGAAGPLEVVDVTPNCEILEAEANSAAVAAAKK